MDHYISMLLLIAYCGLRRPSEAMPVGPGLTDRERRLAGGGVMEVEEDMHEISNVQIGDRQRTKL